MAKKNFFKKKAGYAKKFNKKGRMMESMQDEGSENEPELDENGDPIKDKKKKYPKRELTEYDRRKIAQQQEGINDLANEYKEMKKNERKNLTKQKKKKEDDEDAELEPEDDRDCDQVDSETAIQRLIDSNYYIPKNKGQDPGADLNYKVDKLTSRVALENWIYPEAKQFRSYQFKIVRSALFQNTLVTLPTGLGKTFIASTVMYNFYRWFENGIIFFVAPTKPLVGQQAIAFSNTVTDVPLRHIAELTGCNNQEKRTKIYKEARLFFMTPQTLQGDIEANVFDYTKTVLLVIDEAHRTTGNYAYNNLIKLFENANVGFRILALSATPVSKIENLQTVVTSLRCSMFEVRDEEDSDIKKYTHGKNVIEIVVEKQESIGDIEELIYEIMWIPMKYLRRMGILPNGIQPAFMNMLSIRDLTHRFTSNKNKFDGGSNLFRSFYDRTAFLQSICHAKTMLMTQGTESFRNSWGRMFDIENKDPNRTTFLKSLMEMKEFIHCKNQIERLLNQSSHPKLKKLVEILTAFFSDPKHREKSKVIVFTQFRDSAYEIKGYINQHMEDKSLCRCDVFLGQQQQITQKVQAAWLHQFKKGKLNTLIATCVAEEGMDIGEVNLIVQYDCLRSPIRLLQRQGRTGRFDEGKVILLVAKGTEENKVKMSKQNSERIMNLLKTQSMRRTEEHEREQQAFLDMEMGKENAQKMTKKMLDNKRKMLKFYEYNPRMIPDAVDSTPLYMKLPPRNMREMQQMKIITSKNYFTCEDTLGFNQKTSFLQKRTRPSYWEDRSKMDNNYDHDNAYDENQNGFGYGGRARFYKPSPTVPVENDGQKVAESIRYEVGKLSKY